MVMAMVWEPGAALSEQGVVHTAVLPSRVAVAPAGLVEISTSCAVAMARAGGRRAGGSAVLAGGVSSGSPRGLGLASATSVGAETGGEVTAGAGGVVLVKVWGGGAVMDCQGIRGPTTTSRPAANRITIRNGTKPIRFLPVSGAAVVSPWRMRRGGARVTVGRTFVRVGSFRLPPRGMGFQPWVARHAASSEPINSWQLR